MRTLHQVLGLLRLAQQRDFKTLAKYGITLEPWRKSMTTSVTTIAATKGPKSFQVATENRQKEKDIFFVWFLFSIVLLSYSVISLSPLCVSKTTFSFLCKVVPDVGFVWSPRVRTERQLPSKLSTKNFHHHQNQDHQQHAFHHCSTPSPWYWPRCPNRLATSLLPVPLSPCLPSTSSFSLKSLWSTLTAPSISPLQGIDGWRGWRECIMHYGRLAIWRFWWSFWCGIDYAEFVRGASSGRFSGRFLGRFSWRIFVADFSRMLASLGFQKGYSRKSSVVFINLCAENLCALPISSTLPRFLPLQQPRECYRSPIALHNVDRLL